MHHRLLAHFGNSANQIPFGRRAILFMGKTFSDVCRCGTRISQVPITHSRQMTTRRLRSTNQYIFICDVLAWANGVVYPVWVRQCESLCSQDGQKNSTYAFFHILRIPKIKRTTADFWGANRLKTIVVNYEV